MSGILKGAVMVAAAWSVPLSADGAEVERCRPNLTSEDGSVAFVIRESGMAIVRGPRTQAVWTEVPIRP